MPHQPIEEVRKTTICEKRKIMTRRDKRKVVIGRK